MKIWVTKYALSKGILKMSAGIEMTDGGMISRNLRFRLKAGEWFPDKYEALYDAERRRDEELARLSRKITKIEQMDFSLDL